MNSILLHHCSMIEPSMTKKKKKTILCPLCKGLPRRFIPVPFQAIGLTGSQLATYISIRSFKNSKTKKCFPSMQTIAKRASLSIRTIQAAKQSLRDHGLLEMGSAGQEARVLVPRSRGSNHSGFYLVKGRKIRPP